MDPQKCHDGLTFDRGLAATLVACHGAMKFMESSKLMGEMSLLATSELACCEKICACLRCMGARGARGCLDSTDGAKDLFQMIDSLVWKLKSNVVMLLDQPLERKSLDKRGIDSTAIYCNTILHIESYIC